MGSGSVVGVSVDGAISAVSGTSVVSAWSASVTAGSVDSMRLMDRPVGSRAFGFPQPTRKRRQNRMENSSFFI